MAMPGADPATLCDAAIRATEGQHAIPAGLLAAIGRVESGRHDPLKGGFAPWPWTIDVEGEGHRYENEAAAIAAVRGFQAAGRRSIDVGCMQVNLVNHPDAFASLAAAFDPLGNVAAAADFLDQLYAGTRDWTMATGQYHSGTLALALPYRAKVAAMLQQSGAADPIRLQPAGAPAGRQPTMLAMSMPQARTFGALRGMALRTNPQAAIPGGSGVGRSLAGYRSMPIVVARRLPAG